MDAFLFIDFGSTFTKLTLVDQESHNIIATEKLVKVGELEPDTLQHSGVLVDMIVEGEKPWQI